MFLVNEAELRELIEGVRSGATAPDDAVEQLRRLPFADLGDALVDHHRALRQGIRRRCTRLGRRQTSACASSASSSRTGRARCS
jgi:NCAIR mutase (PurE)-related protein